MENKVFIVSQDCKEATCGEIKVTLSPEAQSVFKEGQQIEEGKDFYIEKQFKAAENDWRELKPHYCFSVKPECRIVAYPLPVDKGDEGVKAIEKDTLAHMMALVRVGWGQAALHLAEYCREGKVTPQFQDFVIDMLNSDKKRAFVLELFEKELVEATKDINDLVSAITPTNAEEQKRADNCADDHISINELLKEFNRQGIDTSNWDGDEGAEKAIVDGVKSHLAGYSAKTDAVEFINWTIEDGWEWSASRNFKGEKSIWYQIGAEKHLTTAELYQLFKSQNK